MSRLVIIDGHAIAHRAYHSIPPLTVNGEPVNAIYGFFSMILSAIDILKPKYLIVCLDAPGPNFRNEEFLGYRAKRKPADINLIKQLPQLPQALTAAGITNFAVPGFEADDLIATIAHKALKKVAKNSQKHLISQVTIITGDKDLMQLVGDKVELFVPIRGLSETKLYQSEEVKEKLGVLPSQVIDLKALMGDMSDNYPGVAGIGPKAATNLLSKYHTLDEIYSHLDEIPQSTRQKLEKDRHNAYLSQKLATLISDVPLKFTLKSTRWNKNSAKNLVPVLLSYNFKSLTSRLHRRYDLTEKLVKSPKVDPNQGSLF